MSSELPLEAITNRDEFGNYDTDMYDCPGCGADHISHCFQFATWVCMVDGCPWSAWPGSDGYVPLGPPKRSKRSWQEIWPEMIAAELPSVDGETDDQRRIREIMNPVNVRWSRGEPL